MAVDFRLSGQEDKEALNVRAELTTEVTNICSTETQA